MAVEFIEKQDGENKNDCERNASKRLLLKLRENYPDTEMIIVEDAISSNIPHVKELEKNKMNFILGIKPGDHKKFFENISSLKSNNKLINSIHESEISTVKIFQKIRYKNLVDLSSSKDGILVNYFELEETVQHKKNGSTKVTNYSWITSIPIDIKNVHDLMKMGRARWKIENETFNTLKNQDYHFEHNYGHGYKNLANNMGIFMFLGFLID